MAFPQKKPLGGDFIKKVLFIVLSVGLIFVFSFGAFAEDVALTAIAWSPDQSISCSDYVSYVNSGTIPKMIIADPQLIYQAVYGGGNKFLSLNVGDTLPTVYEGYTLTDINIDPSLSTGGLSNTIPANALAYPSDYVSSSIYDDIYDIIHHYVFADRPLSSTQKFALDMIALSACVVLISIPFIIVFWIIRRF